MGAARDNEATANPRYGAVKSAERTVELLELLSTAGRRLTLTELYRELSYPKSSLFMLLQTLVARGWVDTDPDRAVYGIGARALLVGTPHLDSGSRDGAGQDPAHAAVDRSESIEVWTPKGETVPGDPAAAGAVPGRRCLPAARAR
jgi:IclR helix-turn-helix domain